MIIIIRKHSLENLYRMVCVWECADERTVTAWWIFGFVPERKQKSKQNKKNSKNLMKIDLINAAVIILNINMQIRT